MMKHDELRCDFGIRMAGLTGLDHGKKEKKKRILDTLGLSSTVLDLEQNDERPLLNAELTNEIDTFTS